MGAVDLVGSSGARLADDEFWCGGMDGQRVEIVAEDFGAEILLCGEPGDTGELFQRQPVFDALESLFNAPTGVIEIAESRRGVFRFIQ